VGKKKEKEKDPSTKNIARLRSSVDNSNRLKNCGKCH
jgi:hypothetical protein